MNSTPRRIYLGDVEIWRYNEGDPLFGLVPTAHAAARFAAGDRVQLRRHANIRKTPSTTGALAGVNIKGFRGTVAVRPEEGPGNTAWVQVNFDRGKWNGWVLDDNLTRLANDAEIRRTPSYFTKGNTVALFRNANVRSDTVLQGTGSNNIIKVMPKDSVAEITDGPTLDSYNIVWYKLRFSAEVEGWVVSDNYFESTANTSTGDTTAPVVTPGTPVTLQEGHIRLQEDTGTLAIDTTTNFSLLGATYTISGAPAGVAIDATTGVMAINSNTAVRQIKTAIVVKATKGSTSEQYTYQLSVGPKLGFSIPGIAVNTAANRKSIVNLAASVNASVLRFDFNSQLIFTGPNSSQWSWGTWDELYNLSVDKGIKPLFIFTGTPTWAQPQGGTSQTYPTTQMSAMATCMQAAAARYPKADWELWNEQNLVTFSPQLDPAKYTAYAKVIATAIRAGNPNAKIISNGLSPAPETVAGHHIQATTYLTGMYAAGAKGVFDSIGFHPYTWPLPINHTANWSGWKIMTSGIRSIMTSNGESNKSVWITEVGGPTGGVNSAGVLSETEQAQMVFDAWDTAAGLAWTGPIFWYTLVDRPASQTGSTDTEDYYGVFKADHKTAKKAVASFKQVLRGSM